MIISDAMVDKALNAWFDSPPSETDQGLERSMRAALKAAMADASALENLIREYARDLRRNSSGGDDYPWEWARATADYLEILIGRSAVSQAKREGVDK